MSVLWSPLNVTFIYFGGLKESNFMSLINNCFKLIYMQVRLKHNIHMIWRILTPYALFIHKMFSEFFAKVAFTIFTIWPPLGNCL